MKIDKNTIDLHPRVYQLARELERKRKVWLSILGGQPQVSEVTRMKFTESIFPDSKNERCLKVTIPTLV